MVNDMIIEDRQRLDEDMRAVSWRRWGPYLSGRPRGMAREAYGGGPHASPGDCRRDQAGRPTGVRR